MTVAAAPTDVRRAQPGTKKLRNVVLWFAPIVGFILLWELLASFGFLNPILIPGPVRVGQAVSDYFTSGVIWEHLFASLRRAALGFSLAVVLGLFLGVLIGRVRTIDRFIGPLIEVFRQLPPLAIFPVLIILLGLGFRSQVAIVLWASLWPILLNTISGTRETDPVLIKAARSLGCSRFQTFSKVVLPSAVPTIATGLRLGGSYSLLVLVAAEMIGANSGLGFLIVNRQYNFLIPEMYASIAILAVLGTIVNFALVAFERRMTRWRQETSWD